MAKKRITQRKLKKAKHKGRGAGRKSKISKVKKLIKLALLRKKRKRK